MPATTDGKHDFGGLWRNAGGAAGGERAVVAEGDSTGRHSAARNHCDGLARLGVHSRDCDSHWAHFWNPPGGPCIANRLNGVAENGTAAFTGGGESPAAQRVRDHRSGAGSRAGHWRWSDGEEPVATVAGESWFSVPIHRDGANYAQ